MKKLLLLATAVCIISLAAAQEIKPADSLYIVTYTTGSLWDNTKQAHEQHYFKDHSANLGKLRKEGVITAGARYGDKGIIFIKAKSMLAARELVLTDPAVVNKLFMADIQNLSVFYDGCIERLKSK
jgi:uncharacterized protein YciI